MTTKRVGDPSTRFAWLQDFDSASRTRTFGSGSGTTTVLNITPITELVFASPVGLDPATYYASFSGSSSALFTPTSATAAQSAVIGILKAAGLDLSSLGDLLSAALKASTTSATGDAYDQALDRFGAALAASGTTLGTFTTSVIASTNASPGTSDVASLPAALSTRARSALRALATLSSHDRVTPPKLQPPHPVDRVWSHGACQSPPLGQHI